MDALIDEYVESKWPSILFTHSIQIDIDEEVDNVYNNRLQRISKLRVKQIIKGFIKRDLNEEKEKDKIRQEIIEEKMTPEERKANEIEKHQTFNEKEEPKNLLLEMVNIHMKNVGTCL